MPIIRSPAGGPELSDVCSRRREGSSLVRRCRSSLATGLTETVWILEKIRAGLIKPVAAHLEWKSFRASGTGLFLWEAFVTKMAKRLSHQGDAEAAVEYFYSRMPDVDEHNAISCTRVRSLIGAAILQTGWETDLALLGSSCIVLRVDG